MAPAHVPRDAIAPKTEGLAAGVLLPTPVGDAEEHLEDERKHFNLQGKESDDSIHRLKHRVLVRANYSGEDLI